MDQIDESLSIVEIGQFSVTRIVSKLFRENGYIVTKQGCSTTLVIDAGGQAEEFIRFHTDHELSPERILLTHGHFDHLGAIKQLCEHYKMPCYVHENDKRLVRQAPLYGIRFSRSRVDAPEQVAPFANGVQWYWDGEPINVWPAPGHTAGGVMYEIGGLIFTGDCLFFEAVGPTRAPEGDINTLRDSIDNLFSHAGDHQLLFPGHGKHWNIGAARQWWQETRRSPPCIDVFAMPCKSACRTGE